MRRWLGNLLASLGILGTVGVIAIGLPAVDRALPADRAVPAGQRYTVGGGITVLTPTGAQVDVTRTRPGTNAGTALFVVGPVRYAIVVTPFTGTLDDAVVRLRRKITENQGYQVTGDEYPVATAQGVAGRQGAYTAPGRAGRYAVFLADDVAVEVTVSGEGPSLAESLPGITRSVRSISYRKPQ